MAKKGNTIKVRMAGDNIRVYYLKRERMTSAKEELHENHYELSYCFTGNISYTIGDESYCLSTHNVILIPKGIKHSYLLTEESTTCCVMFSDLFLDVSFIELFFQYNLKQAFSQRVYCLDENHEAVERILKQMINMRNDSPASCLIQKNLLTEIMIFLHEYSTIPDSNRLLPKHIGQICEYLRNNYYKEIDMNDLADMNHISYGYVSKQFKNAVKMTLHQYLTIIRLDHSIEMLGHAEITIIDICHKCGFKDLSNFYRQFKKRFGTTPLSFRKKSIQNKAITN